MKDILIAFRSLFKKGRHNVIKIVSLSVGLAVGLILIAKIYFEQSYDTFYPDNERIYGVYTKGIFNGELDEHWNLPGGIVPAMKREIPSVEQGTRYTHVGTQTFTMEDDKKKYSGSFILADSCLFDMFPRNMIAGNAKEVLARPMYVLVSKKIADKMGDKVIGRIFEMDDIPGRKMTVGGIFEDFPENSSLQCDILVSLPSIGWFMYDGSMNMLGNDRYFGFVKLVPGVDPESLAEDIRHMQERNQPLEEMKKAGVDLTYTLRPLMEIHNGSEGVKRMVWLLGGLAFALIFTAMMNYILVVISEMVNRSKEVAVRKCYGGAAKDIHSMVLSETFIHLILSLGLAVFLIYLFQDTVHELLNTSVEALVFSKGSLILLGICIGVFLITGLVPGYLYTRIPVASAFRNYRESKRLWKLGMLFFQFVAAGFLFSLVAIIGRQYNYMIDDNPGYAYDRLAYSSLAGVDSTLRQKVLDEMLRLPEVEQVSTCTELPIYAGSGNNIYLPDDDRELFNICDLYYAGNGYIDLMEIPVVMGRSFTENVPSSDEIMVSRSFLDQMAKFADWSDGPIGKTILVSEHSDARGEEDKIFTICGVYENIRIGVIGQSDSRASVLFYNSRPSYTLLIKFKQLTPEALQKASNTLQTLMPNREVTVNAYRTDMVDMYRDSRKFRDSVLIGGLITLIIALVGLLGYTNDEVNRRRAEIAIRKVNGATLKDILSIFLLDILRIAVPALLLGVGIAYYTSQQWLEQFSKKIPLSLLIFIGSAVVLLAVILAVVMINTRRAANDDPVNSLKSE